MPGWLYRGRGGGVNLNLFLSFVMSYGQFVLVLSVCLFVFVSNCFFGFLIVNNYAPMDSLSLLCELLSF